MTYRGKYSKGTVTLPRGVDIPEGAEVEVTPVAPPPNGGSQPESSTFYERHKEFIGALDGLPSDLAESHDHYLYGAPKKVKP
jgi:hypothetical protein